MKKILLLIIVSICCIAVSGCGNKNIEGPLEDIMTKVYASIKEEEKPMMLTNIEVTKENAEMYLGTSDIEFEEALASESAIGSIAHSVILIRVKDNANVELIEERLEDTVNPRKWICVEAEEVEVESRGNLILVVMSNEITADKIVDEFNKL